MALTVDIPWSELMHSHKQGRITKGELSLQAFEVLLIILCERQVYLMAVLRYVKMTVAPLILLADRQ
jgi:hypothetical protein